MTRTRHSTVPGLHGAIQEVIDAIAAETNAFRTAPPGDAGEAITDAAVVRKAEAVQALRRFDKAAILADISATGDLDILHALALDWRHTLVMNGAYMDEEMQTECLMVDIILHQAEPYASVPLLWFDRNGECDERPSDEVLQAEWGK